MNRETGNATKRKETKSSKFILACISCYLSLLLFPFFTFVFFFFLKKQTVRELLLEDGDIQSENSEKLPLLWRMSQPDSAYMKALAEFQHRLVRNKHVFCHFNSVLYLFLSPLFSISLCFCVISSLLLFLLPLFRSISSMLCFLKQSQLCFFCFVPRTVYSNIAQDFQVPFASSSISPSHSYDHHKKKDKNRYDEHRQSGSL